MKLQSDIKIILYFTFLASISLTLKSQTVTDYDGNVYHTAIIGNQTWMAENLRTLHYDNGNTIEDGIAFDFYPFEVAMAGSDTTKYFFYYNNDSKYSSDYGCLYNWFAAVNGTAGSNSNPSGIQGVCPAGWHIPGLAEWEELKNYVGENIAGLLEGGPTGFNVQFGGYRRDMDNSFDGIDGGGAYISTNVDLDPGYIWLFAINSNPLESHYWSHRKTTGYSVRCIKDTGTNTSINDNLNLKISIKPNPVNDKLYLETNELKIKNVKIYTLNGKKVGINTAGENFIDISGLESGVYLLMINFEDFYYIKKIIIK